MHYFCFFLSCAYIPVQYLTINDNSNKNDKDSKTPTGNPSNVYSRKPHSKIFSAVWM